VKRHQKSQQQVDEVIALRKQVADLKEAATARKRVEDALRRSEARHRNLVERCPAALAEIDANGYLLFANDAFARKLEYSSKSEMLALGTGMTVFGGLDERERALSILRQSAEERRFETVLRTRCGGSRPFGVSACAAGSGGDSPARFILVLGGDGVVGPVGTGAGPRRRLTDAGTLVTGAQNGGA
jgi:PAS domain S-box-containing protein